MKMELKVCQSCQSFYRNCRRQEGLRRVRGTRRGFFPRWDPFHDYRSGFLAGDVSGGGAMEADIGGSDRSLVVCSEVLGRVRRGAWFLACQSIKKNIVNFCFGRSFFLLRFFLKLLVGPFLGGGLFVGPKFWELLDGLDCRILSNWELYFLP